MEPMKITVLESYDVKFCCVCAQNGTSYYLNIFKNVIVFAGAYISIAQIIADTLGYEIIENSSQPQDICVNCKTKIVDFFIFRKRCDEARRIFFESPSFEDRSVKNMLLNVVDQINTDQDEHCSEAEAEAEDLSQEVEETPVTISEEIPQIFYEDSHNDFDDASESTYETEYVEEAATNPKPPRIRNPDGWKRNRRKFARNSGQPYITASGKFKEAKQMRSDCGLSCRMQCSRKITEEDRQKNFEFFYALGDIEKQRKFVFDHMKSFKPRQNKPNCTPGKARSVQRNYYLDASEETVQVCKLMFLNTFAISSQMIDTICKKASDGQFCDTRGKFDRKRKSVEEVS